jgi:hypothetical protein
VSGVHRDLDSTGREFFNAFEATWTTALCCLQSWRQTGIRGFHLSDRHICPSTFCSQVHHPLTHAVAGRNLPDFQSPSSHHCIQAIKPKSKTAREACKPGGGQWRSFFLKWPCSGVAKCSNMFQRQGMKRSTTVPTPRAAFIGKIRVWGWPGSCS